jgi:hypothetical protein
MSAAQHVGDLIAVYTLIFFGFAILGAAADWIENRGRKQ